MGQKMQETSVLGNYPPGECCEVDSCTEMQNPVF